MANAKPDRHRFPMTIIPHSIRLYHLFPLSDRNVQEMLYHRGMVVNRVTLREWCIKFSPLFADGLRHWELRQGSRWLLDKVCTSGDFSAHQLSAELFQQRDEAVQFCSFLRGQPRLQGVGNPC